MTGRQWQVIAVVLALAAMCQAHTAAVLSAGEAARAERATARKDHLRAYPEDATSSERLAMLEKRINGLAKLNAEAAHRILAQLNDDARKAGGDEKEVAAAIAAQELAVNALEAEARTLGLTEDRLAHGHPADDGDAATPIATPPVLPGCHVLAPSHNASARWGGQFQSERTLLVPAGVASIGDLWQVQACGGRDGGSKVDLSTSDSAPKTLTVNPPHSLHLRFQRMRGCVDDDVSAAINTTDPETVRLAKELGSDELYVDLRGPELVVCPVTVHRHKGQDDGSTCSTAYVATCHIMLPGDYRVVAFHLRSDYRAVSEGLVGRRIQDDEGPGSHCAAPWAPLHLDQMLGPMFFVHARVLASAPASVNAILPLCTAVCPRLSSVGRWVSDSQPVALRDNTAPEEVIACPTKRLKFAGYTGLTSKIETLKCRRGSAAAQPRYIDVSTYKWRPRHCTLSRNATALAELLRAKYGIKRIYFFGDSHTILLRSIWEMHPGLNATISTLPSWCSGFGSCFWQQKQTTLDTTKALELEPEGTVVLFNEGQHIMTDHCGQSAAWYRAKMAKVAKAAAAWSASGRGHHVFWTPIPTLPLRTDGDVRTNADRRTVDRVMLFNRIADEEMAIAGVAVLDTVAPQQAFATLGLDPAHYTEPNFLSLMPAYILNQLHAFLDGRVTRDEACLQQREYYRKHAALGS